MYNIRSLSMKSIRSKRQFKMKKYRLPPFLYNLTSTSLNDPLNIQYAIDIKYPDIHRMAYNLSIIYGMGPLDSRTNVRYFTYVVLNQTLLRLKPPFT